MNYIFLTALLISVSSFASQPCDNLGTSSFATVQDYDTGLGPHGRILGKWTLNFDQPALGQVRERISDAYMIGTYSCQGKEGEISYRGPMDTSPKVVGYFNSEAGLLIWNGRWYKKTN
jgi:hypothetical protein